MLLCSFFFFFQAEDGIRDLYVTGVQTCALPICAGRQDLEQGADRKHPPPARRRPAVLGPALDLHQAGPDRRLRRVVEHQRSEERRVGKECRSRWSRYQEKKKKRTTSGSRRQ